MQPSSLTASLLPHPTQAAPSSPQQRTALTTSLPRFHRALSSSSPFSGSFPNPTPHSPALGSGCTRKTTSTPTPNNLTASPAAIASPSPPRGVSPTNSVSPLAARRP